MSDDNVIPLFTAEAQEEKPATLTPAPEGPIFFHFPKSTRFEFTKAGEMIISLDPNAEEVVKKMWASYINVTCAPLILNGIEHRVQYRRGPDGKHTIPDVLRISMVRGSETV